MRNIPAYKSHDPHRGIGDTSEKSQWTITEPEEIACFTAAYLAGWVIEAEAVGWGLHLDSHGRPQILGTSAIGAGALWWAKFVGKRLPWHGYPADIVRRQRDDCPNGSTIKAWLARKHISKQAARKIAQGKPCRPR
jgi:hypothetical protein